MKFTQTKSRKQVKMENQDAAKIIKVDGGYIIFATMTEWQTWIKQK